MTKQFYIFGHRGAPALTPENTIPSFMRAIEERVNGIELDVHKVDHQLVVIHDESVDRTSNGSGKLQAFSFKALRQLDFGNGATVPTLVEVIEATPSSILINVELKGQHTGKAVAQLLPDYPKHKFMVSSFDRSELVEFNDVSRSDSNTEIALLGAILNSRLMEEALQLNARILNVSAKFLTRKQLNIALHRGFRINAYTVNNATHARELRSLGVSGVFTDNPVKLRGLHHD